MANYEQEIKSFVSHTGAISQVERGRAFLDWTLLKLFNRVETDLENDDIKDGVLFTDGARDYGIDCAFVDGDILYIIQGKLREYHNHDNVSAFIENISRFFDLENAQRIRSKLVPVRSSIFDDEIREIRVYYITNNYMDDENASYSYTQLCKKFNETYTQSFGKTVSVNIIGYEKYDLIQTGILLELPKEVKKSQSKIVLARFFENRDKTSVVAEIPLKELARLVKYNEKYIFASNIRNYKGLNAINKGIKDTYEKHPKNFWFYNNGVTIVCSKYDLDMDRGNITIYAPQIVNGCQTAKTIYDCWEQSSARAKEEIDGTILIKVIQDSKSEHRKNITKYTNSQTAVTGKDFFALEDFHVTLQKSFKELGYYYEIQSNSIKYVTQQYKGAERYQHLFDAEFKKRNAVNAKSITQTYVAALLKMPAKARSIGQFMPGCDKYDLVFNSSTPYDPKFYILPYGCWYYFSRKFQLPESRVIDKDKWKNSLLFATFTFFRVIEKTYFPNEDMNYTSERFINLCDDKIRDKCLFEKIALTTYRIIKDFYNDSTIKDIIGDNFPKFVKGTIESNSRVLEILDDKIDSRIDDIFES